MESRSRSRKKRVGSGSETYLKSEYNGCYDINHHNYYHYYYDSKNKVGIHVACGTGNYNYFKPSHDTVAVLAE